MYRAGAKGNIIPSRLSPMHDENPILIAYVFSLTDRHCFPGIAEKLAILIMEV